MDALAIVPAIARREIAADGDDEIAPARREHRAGVPQDRRTMHAREDFLHVTAGGGARLGRGLLLGVVARRGHDPLFLSFDPAAAADLYTLSLQDAPAHRAGADAGLHDGAR